MGEGLKKLFSKFNKTPKQRDNFRLSLRWGQSLFPKIFCCALIMFRNKSDYLIKSLELNNSKVARLVCADARMAKCSTSKRGQPFRGKLVSTFREKLINGFCREGLNLLLFEAIRTCNLRIEKRHAST